MPPANTGECRKGLGKNGWQKLGNPRKEPDSGLVLLLLQRKLPWLMMRLQGDSMDLMLTSISPTFNPTQILILQTDSNGFLQRTSSPYFLLVACSISMPNLVFISSSCESETDTQIISKKSKSQSQIENLTTKEKDVDISSTEEMLQTEEPQIDLNEFLQQLGIAREEKPSQTERIAFAEKSFNWDAVIQLNGIGADQQGANPSFHVHDIQEELTWPTSIGNF
ncbi:hypothetical protein SLEP1_g36709 [Rubroshorea leprosula]|uniref:Uncharacterized protein n=1 Tax=Rubroshorea leprosula TaxID=152421 RepID=A0AAV5KSU5_9ROSI|nr:hypothetical protein SLEP1_g36709 [Rubroshorea leprosula]